MQSLSGRALLLEGPALGYLLCCLFKFWALLDQALWFQFSKSSAESVPGPACIERENIHVYILVYINQHFYNNESPFKIILPPHPLSLPISKPFWAPYMILIVTCDGCFLVSAGLWLVVSFWSSLSCGRIQCSCVLSLYLTSRSPLFPHILLTSLFMVKQEAVDWLVRLSDLSHSSPFFIPSYPLVPALPTKLLPVGGMCPGLQALRVEWGVIFSAVWQVIGTQEHPEFERTEKWPERWALPKLGS